MSFNPLCHVTIDSNIVVNKLKLERNTKSSILKAMERAHKTSYVTLVSFLWLRPFIGHKDAQWGRQWDTATPSSARLGQTQANLQRQVTWPHSAPKQNKRHALLLGNITRSHLEWIWRRGRRQKGINFPQQCIFEKRHKGRVIGIKGQVSFV